MNAPRTGRAAAIILGAAAGGGYPQWNCRCDVCRLAWQGDPRVRPRTQSSLAVTGDGRNWVLFNASPDLRTQIVATPALHPREGPRDSPISAVVLTNGDVDHIAGLLSLRERQPFRLVGTGETLAHIAADPVFRVLSDAVVRQPVPLGERISLPGEVAVTLFAVPGKVPLWAEGEAVALDLETGLTVGAEIEAGTSRLCYVPGAAAVNADLAARLARADVVLFDGTLFTDDEMIRTGTGVKTGRRMGHMPIAGPGGSLEALSGLAARRIYVHINNTNPILVAGSPERQGVEAAGWEIAEDGMEIAL